MTKTATQAAALVLSAFVTLTGLAGVSGIATQQYAAADGLAMAPYGQAHVAEQHVTIIGHRTA